MRWKDTPEDRWQRLGDDLRRINGFLTVALDEAKALGVEVPEEVAGADERGGCVAALARWGREIRDRVPRSDQEER